jgi:hypothetical protein
MIIIETCPKCGHDLMDTIIATYPPIPKKECTSCGWSWTGEREEVVRVPFGGNGLIVDDLVGLDKYDKLEVNLDDITLLNSFNLEDATISAFEQSSCVNCSNNPKNGGSGICFCTLGQQAIY